MSEGSFTGEIPDGGGSDDQLTCPGTDPTNPEISGTVCSHITSVAADGDGQDAGPFEDDLITAALQRFDIVPPRGRARIEDLKGCYEAFTEKGLVEPVKEAKPTSLQLWRATVARMEREAQEREGKKVEGGFKTEGGDLVEAVLAEGSSSAHKLPFKRNFMLQSLVTLSQQQADPSSSSTAPTMPPAQSPLHEQSPHTHLPGHLDDAIKDESHVVQHQQQGQSAQPEAGGGDDGSDMAIDDYDPTEAPSHPDVPTQQPEPVVMMSGDMPIPRKAPPPYAATTTTATDPSLSAAVPPATDHNDDDTHDEMHYFDDGNRGASASGEMGAAASTASAGGDGGGDVGAEQKLSNPPEGSRHIWAGMLSSNVTEAMLREACSAYGPLEALRLLKRNGNQVLGFIHFNRTEDAIACKEGLDGTHSQLGNGIKIQYQERGNHQRCPTLRVHNISPQVSEADLKRIFMEFGHVRSVHINNRTFIGFVCFETVDEASVALSKMHDTEIMGHHVFMDYAARDRDRDGRHGGREGPPPPRGGPPPHLHPPPTPPSMRYDDGGRAPKVITLSSPRGCPPFEVFGEQNLAQLRELVDLLQYRLPMSQRQTLEEALQNRDLYDNIQQLVGRNRRDLTGVLQTLRAELGLPPRRPPGVGCGVGGGRDRDSPRGSRERERERGKPLREGGGAYGDRPPPRDRDQQYGYGGGGGGGRGGGYSRDQPPSSYDERGGGGHEPSFYEPAGGGGRYQDSHNSYNNHRPPYDNNRGPPPRSPPRGGDGWRGDDRDGRGGRQQPMRGDRYGGGNREPEPYGRGGERDGMGRYGPSGGGARAPPDDVYGGGGGGRGRGPPSPVRSRWDAGAGGPPRRSPPRRSRSASPSRKRSRSDYVGGGGGGRYDAGPPPRSRSRSPPRRRDDHVVHRDGPYGSAPPPVAAYPPPPPPHRAPAPLEAECEQFLQSMMGGAPPTHAPPPLPPVPPAAPSYHGHRDPPNYGGGGGAGYGGGAGGAKRLWLSSAQAATYPCYETVLAMVKEILMPYYRDQRITKDDFKRSAEETTLKIVQQLVDVGLESRPDVPPHYRQVAFDAIRASLKL